MKALLAVLSNFFKRFVSQEFIPEGTNLFDIPFTRCDVYIDGWKMVIRYRGEEWKKNRNEFMLNKHGMSWEDTQKEENRHLFVAKICYDGV